jgi:tetratricopeptide (TPR) repeat protein
LGRYDQSLSLYLRALDFRRGSDDKRGVAIESYSIGTIFDYQSRYGAAVKSKEEALRAFRDLKQRDMWLGEILSGYGNSLSLSGRMDNAVRSLDEAMNVAKELKDQALIAQTTLFQANRLYYSGDFKGASGLAEQAAQAASNTSDPSLVLLARAATATTAVAEPPSRIVASKLAGFVREADRLGLKSLAFDCAILRAETLLKLGDRATARQEADRALGKAETLGLRLPLAKAHYVRAEVLRLGGDAKARAEYAVALRLLEEIKGEDGNQDVLKRADLGAIYAECAQWSKAAPQ